MDQLKKHAEKIRFAIVGGANTALDFGILLILTNLFGVNSIAANYISTSLSFVFSFFVNKSFTFKSNTGNVKKQFALFIIITIIGLWIIQPVIIWGVKNLIQPLNWNETLVLIVAKLIATVASLIWNYLFYSRLVFKKEVK